MHGDSRTFEGSLSRGVSSRCLSKRAVLPLSFTPLDFVTNHDTTTRFIILTDTPPEQHANIRASYNTRPYYSLRYGNQLDGYPLNDFRSDYSFRTNRGSHMDDDSRTFGDSRAHAATRYLVKRTISPPSSTPLDVVTARHNDRQIDRRVTRAT